MRFALLFIEGKSGRYSRTTAKEASTNRSANFWTKGSPFDSDEDHEKSESAGTVTCAGGDRNSLFNKVRFLSRTPTSASYAVVNAINCKDANFLFSRDNSVHIQHSHVGA